MVKNKSHYQINNISNNTKLIKWFEGKLTARFLFASQVDTYDLIMFMNWDNFFELAFCMTVWISFILIILI